jgi:orotate phosphoribosyltransferase
MARDAGLVRLVALIREHALIEGGDFELASGARAATYIDLRRVTMHPEGADLIADLLLERCRDAGAVAVGGMATAAIPPVACVVLRSQERGTPLRGFYVRDKAKTRGTQRQIEGQLDKGDRVVLIEDTMTSGRSTMTAVEAVRAEGSTVAKVITVVDRQQGGAELYAAEGIPFEALVTLSDITGA